jgi:Flp pilus assembly protein TadD
VLKESPNNIRAMTAKAISLREMGRNEEALVYFNRALEFNPVNSFIWYNKSIAFAQSREV